MGAAAMGPIINAVIGVGSSYMAAKSQEDSMDKANESAERVAAAERERQNEALAAAEKASNQQREEVASAKIEYGDLAARDRQDSSYDDFLIPSSTQSNFGLEDSSSGIYAGSDSSGLGMT